jgi:hypothetical protein
MCLSGVAGFSSMVLILLKVVKSSRGQSARQRISERVGTRCLAPNSRAEMSFPWTWTLCPSLIHFGCNLPGTKDVREEDPDEAAGSYLFYAVYEGIVDIKQRAIS